MSGVVLPFWLDRPPGEAMSIALEAERLGYDELWIGELYHFDAFALAAHVASVTSSIVPVVGPVAAGVRDPVSIARALATVVETGNRQVRLALGSSTPIVVERFHERSYGDEPTRMQSAVEAVRTQLRSGRSPTGYRSALGRFEPHISVAALGPRMVATASAVADRMVVNLVTPRQAGALATMTEIPTVAWVVGALDPGPAAHRQVAGQIAHYLAAPGYGEMFVDAGFADLVDRARGGSPIADLAREVTEDVIMSVAMYGSASDIDEAWRAYCDAGVEVAIVPATADDESARRVLEHFADV